MRPWESDPLFTAAEVVQDSTDRMESIYRLLLHEQSLFQGDHKDGELLSSIEYHRRDLVTTLETAKWQLEDLEREVNMSAIVDKSIVKQNLIARHMQFIKCFREQISLVERSMTASLGNSLRTMNLNEQDRDGLTMFHSGGNPVKHIAEQDVQDNDILRRFLDPSVSSSSKEDTNEEKSGRTQSLDENEIYLDRNPEFKENFKSPTNMDSGPSSSFQGDKYGRYDKEGNRDLEANEVNVKTYLQKNMWVDDRGNIFGTLEKFLFTHERWASRSFTKRLKDGEQQRQSPLYSHPRHGIQRHLAGLRSAFGFYDFSLPCSRLSAQSMQSGNWIRDYSKNFMRYLHHTQARNHPLLSILALFLTLLILGILVS